MLSPSALCTLSIDHARRATGEPSSVKLTYNYETEGISSSLPQSNRADHLSYLFQPQFAGGRTFCASMLDTMLYQSHFKPYIVDLVRQLLGCQQADDSAYLWKVPRLFL